MSDNAHEYFDCCNMRLIQKSQILDVPNQQINDPIQNKDSGVLKSPMIKKNLEKYQKFMQIQVQPAKINSGL